MRAACVMLGVAVLVAGCNQDMPVRADAADAGSSDKSAVTAAAAGSKSAAQMVVPFNDMQSFDKQLEKSLKNQPEKVTVTVDDRISLKEMPTRVDKWLAAVDNGGGNVAVKSDVPEPKTRALPLIGIAVSAYQFFKEQAKDAQYEAAKPYDATIYYKRDANGDRLVDRIELQRRP